MTPIPTCTPCGAPTPLPKQHGVCDDCYFDEGPRPTAIPTLWELTTHGGTRRLVPRGWGAALLDLHVAPQPYAGIVPGAQAARDRFAAQTLAITAAVFPPEAWEYR